MYYNASWGYIYMHVSYRVKIKDVLIKFIHVLQNKIKNKKTKNKSKTLL